MDKEIDPRQRPQMVRHPLRDNLTLAVANAMRDGLMRGTEDGKPWLHYNPEQVSDPHIDEDGRPSIYIEAGNRLLRVVIEEVNG